MWRRCPDKRSAYPRIPSSCPELTKFNSTSNQQIPHEIPPVTQSTHSISGFRRTVAGFGVDAGVSHHLGQLECHRYLVDCGELG
jgi:hypothetical protein